MIDKNRAFACKYHVNIIAKVKGNVNRRKDEMWKKMWKNRPGMHFYVNEQGNRLTHSIKNVIINTGWE